MAITYVDEKVQEDPDFKGKTRTRVRKHEWVFQGIIFCGNCGCAMTGDMKKGKYIYYRCTGYKGKCPKRYERDEELARQFEEVLTAIQLNPEVHALLVRALKECHTDEKRFHKEQVASIYRQLEMAEKKRILNLVLANSIWLNAQLIPKYRQPFDLMAVMKTKAPPKARASGENPGGWEEWYTRQESNL